MVKLRFFLDRVAKLVFQENQLREVFFMSKYCNFLCFFKIKLLIVFSRKNGYFSYFLCFFWKKKFEVDQNKNFRKHSQSRTVKALKSEKYSIFYVFCTFFLPLNLDKTIICCFSTFWSFSLLKFCWLFSETRSQKKRIFTIKG